jgi:hypothetical protein
MDVVDEKRTKFFGLLASAHFISVEATDAGSEFIEPGVNGGTPPPEHDLRLAGGPVAVFECRLRLEASPLGTGQQLRRRPDRLKYVFREICHGRLLLERRH